MLGSRASNRKPVRACVRAWGVRMAIRSPSIARATIPALETTLSRLIESAKSQAPFRSFRVPPPPGLCDSPTAARSLAARAHSAVCRRVSRPRLRLRFRNGCELMGNGTAAVPRLVTAQKASALSSALYSPSSVEVRRRGSPRPVPLLGAA